MDDIIYKIAFASIRGMGVDLAQKLLDIIPSEKDFFLLSERELRSITGSKAKMCDRNYRQSLLERAEREMEFITEKHVNMLYFTDNAYPRRMLEASDAPLMLYTSGSCDLNSAHVVSVVGTRHATQYGVKFCDALVADFAARLPGTVIVSGLAYGIDIAAHRAALKHGTPTVAVLAQGLNKIYPAHHRPDAVKIAKSGGMVITDYQSQDDIHRGNFLARNRIIAALADCTVVVESATSGGALVTASLAQSYNRDVFAVPGRVNDEYSKGCNKIIRKSQAMSITCADDIIEAMRWDALAKSAAKQQELFPSLTAEEQTVVDKLRDKGETHINDLAADLQIPVYRLMSTLVELDCRGIIATLPGCRYALT